MRFRLRQVAPAELLARATARLAVTAPPKRSARREADDRLSAVFGIELESRAPLKNDNQKFSSRGARRVGSANRSARKPARARTAKL